MANQDLVRPCNIVLHDDRVSSSDVLGGIDVLPTNVVAYLSSEDTEKVLIIATGETLGRKDVSVHVRLAARVGFVNRTHGKIEQLTDQARAIADHVEILLRDQILSRADLWHLTEQLDKKILYKSSDVDYLDSPAALVQHVYQDGNTVGSAVYRNGQTKAIVRSGNARFMILIQISAELLGDWINGDLMYERLLIDFLPNLFGRWDVAKVRHTFSVILFGRSAYQNGHHSDFFITMNLDTPCRHWRQAVLSLKKLFNGGEVPQAVSLAADGNLLEAINITAAGCLARREGGVLTGTGSTIVAITAGSGLFNADHSLLGATTRVLLGSSVGVDIVSLAAKPSHPVPLFSYTLDEKEEFALPHWADISFYRSPGQDSSQTDRLRPMLQNSLDFVAIPMLEKHDFHHITDLEECDDHVFSPAASIHFGRAQATAHVHQADISTSAANDAHVPKAKLQPPMLQQRPSASSITTTISLRQGAKSMNSLLSNRKISMGPRGLAPVASTVAAAVSVAHVNQDKDAQHVPQASAHKDESAVARQFRASLRRRPSQTSVLSRTTEIADMPTQAIDIDHAPSMTARPPPTVASLGPDTDNRGPVSTSANAAKLGSNSPGVFNNMASSPQDLSTDPSLTANSPWLTLLNPCNLRKDNMRIAEQYRQWRHIFPKAIDSADFKWASLCFPAILPLYQDLCPTPAFLRRHYSRSTRRLICAQPDGSGQRSHDLMQRLMALRLVYGFQIISQAEDVKARQVIMSIGASYHELRCLSEVELEIVEYKTQSSADPSTSEARTSYEMEVKTYYAKSSVEVLTTLAGTQASLDWAFLDHQMLSGDPAIALSRIRLVLLPVEPVKSIDSNPDTKELADDEKRIEGIQRLTQQWQRHKVLSAEDQRHQVSVARKTQSRTGDGMDPNPLSIEYHTRDPSALINAQETGFTSENSRAVHQSPLFAESEMFHSSNFDVLKLVRQMQEPSPQGVELRDRRWLAHVHLRCFRGDEMTNWLLGAFKDLQTRDDAVEMGNELMQRGVFTHVRRKHAFLDGNYFYQIAAAYRSSEHANAIASVFSRASTRSVPATPNLDVRSSPRLYPDRADTETSEVSSAHGTPADRKQVMLSQMLKYNVDPSGKSAYEETVNIHYDRIHNPENCYHVYLDWALTTPLLVRDAITRWTNLVEPYGLKLVEIPLLEASKHSALHPFQQPVYLKLAIDPPAIFPSTPLLHNVNRSPRQVEDKFFFQKAILRRLGFALDLESIDSFSSRLDIKVTWGEMDFSMTQFVHQSGLVLAQVSKQPKWDLLLLPNSLAADRSHALAGRDQVRDTTMTILDSARKLTQDAKALRAIYEEASKPRMMSPSPLAKAGLATIDADVPPMQLPPHLLYRVFS